MKGRRGRRDSRQAATCNGDRDRLCQLPDDALLNILERLGTLDAIRTCILSKQMLKLPTMLSRIFIDFNSALRSDDQSSTTTRELARINDVVADVTDRILSTRPPLIPVRKLELRFVLRRYDCLSIGKSVARAIAARRLDGAVEFKVLTECAFEHCTDADLLRFGRQFNTFLSDCPDAFACLTRLELHNLRFVAEPGIPKVFSACQRLESLRLHECDAGVNSVLQVEHPRLVELEIFYGKCETVEIVSLPKLQRMSYNNWCFDEDPLYLDDVPQLSKISLSKTCHWGETMMLSKLLANVSTITDLHLNFESEKIWVRPERPRVLAPVLKKLRHLNMDFLPEGCDIAWTMFLLEAAPSLEELRLTVCDHWRCTEKQRGRSKKKDVEWEPPAPDFKHKNLAKLSIHGFQFDDNFTRYVRRVIEAAVNIEEISLYDRKVCKFCAEELDGCQSETFPWTYPRTSEEKDSVRQKIIDGLAMSSPNVIHFRS